MRRYHRTIFLVEVLTDDGPYNPDDLGQIHHDITTGGASGQFEMTSSIPVSGETMANLLQSQGSEPGFFSLTDEGKPLEDDAPDCDCGPENMVRT